MKIVAFSVFNSYKVAVCNTVYYHAIGIVVSSIPLLHLSVDIIPYISHVLHESFKDFVQLN